MKKRKARSNRDRILSIDQIASEQILPLSKRKLYSLAADGDGPFYKVGGRWMAVESDLRDWVREGQRGRVSDAASVSILSDALAAKRESERAA